MPVTLASNGLVGLADGVEFELLPQPTSAAATDSAAVHFKCVNFIGVAPPSGLRCWTTLGATVTLTTLSTLSPFLGIPSHPRFIFFAAFLLVRYGTNRIKCCR